MNPIKQNRLMRNLSMTFFARYAGVSVSAIQQVEDGTLINVPESIHKAFERFDFEVFSELSYDRAKIRQEYAQFISDKRTKIREKGRPQPLPSVSEIDFSNQDKHPFEIYVNSMDITISTFCSFACVPKNSLFRYVSTKPGIRKQRSMPSVIRFALIECGMSFTEVNELDKLGKAYYDLNYGGR